MMVMIRLGITVSALLMCCLLSTSRLIAAPATPGYGGDIATRGAWTGDWGGARDTLARKGYTFNLGLTQILQGNSSGGFNVPLIWRYQTSQDIELLIDTGKAGWWKHGRFRVLVEGREGKSVNATQGSLFLVNQDSLYPRPLPLDANIWDVSAFSYTHIFSTQFNLTVGKLQTRPANEFASNEKTQFFSNKFNAAPPYGSIVPTVNFYGAVLGYQPASQVKLIFAIVNRNETGAQSRLGTLLHGPKSTFLGSELTVHPDGHPGHQRVTLGYASRRQSITSPPNAGLQPQVLSLSTTRFRNYDWLIAWDMDQYFTNVANDPHRGLGMFSKAVYTDGVVNPIKFFFNIGLGGKGVSQARSDDSFGAGFYYNRLSHDLPAGARPLLANEYGIEAYYNYAVYPWLHLSPDIQWITQPTRRSAGSPVVLGVRMQITF